MKLTVKSALVLFATVAIAASTAIAQTGSTGGGSGTNAPAKPHVKGKRYHGNVTSVSASAMTFTFTNNGGSEVIHVNGKTRIQKDQVAATFSDIKVGKHVTGTERPDESGDLVASTVNISEPKTAEAPAAGK